MNEQWKPIPGYEGLYDASSLGRIRSAPGKTTRNAKCPVRIWKSRIMKEKRPVANPRHDARVSLWKNGEHKDYLVARLVASAWIGSPSEGMTVNHINGDYSDNRPENLEWIPLVDNIKHGFNTGLYESICQRIKLAGESGDEHIFSSLSQASAFLGRNHGYVSGVLAKGRSEATNAAGKRFYIVLT